MPKNKNVKPMTLIFDNSPFKLKQWKVIDQQNIEITISLFDITTDTDLAADLFKFDKKSSIGSSGARRK